MMKTFEFWLNIREGTLNCVPSLALPLGLEPLFLLDLNQGPSD